MGTPLRQRPLDIVYMVFFIIHVPIAFMVDLYPFYPASAVPSWMTNLRSWYITTYADQFFIAAPAWFKSYLWMELLYHAPLSVWAIGAIQRDDPRLPIHLLIYAVQTAITTLTCIADYLSWSSYSNAQKVKLSQLYVPYLAVSVFMGVDMVRRLETRLTRATAPSKKAL